MRASEAAGSESETLVLTAFLKGAPAGHAGSFGAANNLAKHVDAFVQRSPGLCNRTSLHVVHDLPSMRNVSHHRGVVLHYFAPDPRTPPGDLRWEHYARVLPALRWKCAWAVDVSDVDVLQLPPCAAPHLPEGSIAAASDSCSTSVKAWLHKLIREAGVAESLGARFQRFLDGPWSDQYTGLDRDGHGPWALRRGAIGSRLNKLPVLNTGIVGGRRADFEPALRAVAARLRNHYAAAPPHVNVDMAFWNAQLLERPVVTGYPHGPVNLPMWGRLASVPSPWCRMHADPMNRSASCSHQCRYEWINATLGHYWFAHKLQRWWTRFNAASLSKSNALGWSCSGGKTLPLGETRRDVHIQP